MINPLKFVSKIFKSTNQRELDRLKKIADKHNMKLVSIADLIAYRLENETLIERTYEVKLNTEYGPFNAISYKQLTDDTEHLALVKGAWDSEESVSVRVHASSMIGDVFQVSDLGKGPQLPFCYEIIYCFFYIWVQALLR